MTGLTNQQVLDLWDQAPPTPTARGLAVLAAASGRVPHDLAALTIGCRDRLLIDVREQTFGSAFDTCVTCPLCGARLECTFSCSDVRMPAADGAPQTHRIDLPEGAVEVRLPTSHDLMAIEAVDDADRAAGLLIARCAIGPHASGAGGSLTISPAVAATVADQMAALDPQADVLMQFTCTTCGGAAAAVFDIVEYLWMEIRARAVRLMADVHDLARAYGWSERSILALSDARRAAYLQLLV